MKCPNCGFESELSYPVCPQCQSQIQPNSAAQTVLAALQDVLFLVICILMSAVCILSIAADGLPLINILIAVFLWLTYFQAKKGTADANHLRSISGAVYANYVINYVLSGLVVLLGLIFSVLLDFVFSDPELLDSIISGLGEVQLDVAMVRDLLTTLPSILIFVAFLLIAAIMVVINVFSMRYVHRFTKSVYTSVQTGAPDFKHTTAAKVWLFIFGGASALTLLVNLGSDLLPTLCSAAECATCILAGVLIHKYFSAPKAQTSPWSEE